MSVNPVKVYLLLNLFLSQNQANLNFWQRQEKWVEGGKVLSHDLTSQLILSFPFLHPRERVEFSSGTMFLSRVFIFMSQPWVSCLFFLREEVSKWGRTFNLKLRWKSLREEGRGFPLSWAKNFGHNHLVFLNSRSTPTFFAQTEET